MTVTLMKMKMKITKPQPLKGDDEYFESNILN